MQQLTGLDAYFLYLETETAPMHVGGLYIFDGDTKQGLLNFDGFLAHMQSRLHLTRIFRQRLITLPMNLGHPFWVDDPEFDIKQHVKHIALSEASGLTELRGVAQEIFAKPLDRSRPLWEVTFIDGNITIEGYDHPICAMVTKVHHAAIDGMSGAEILSAMLDPSPEGRELTKAPAWTAKPLPNKAEMVALTYGKAIRKTATLAGYVGKTVAGAAHVLKETLKPPPFPFAAPRTSLNVNISEKRCFGFKVFPLQRFKNIKNNVKGATVNDVVLTVCAGGLRKWLKLNGKPLVAMVPVSVRGVAGAGQMGNQVSAMLVSLATDVASPLRRLNTINKGVTSSKIYQQALSTAQIMEFIPSETAALASRLYTRTRIAEKHRPFFNLVITNVPGPPVPLYLAGAKLVASAGSAPIIDGLGLILVITSYAGTLTISAQSAPEAVHDPELFLAGIAEELDDLEAMAAGLKEEPQEPVSQGNASWKQKVDQVEQSLASLEAFVAKETEKQKKP